MRSFKEVEKLMAELEIPYKIVEHLASHSTEESDQYIEGHEGCRSKTLVLANKKSTQFYMVIMDDSKRVEMNKLGEILGVNRLHFVSEERLESMLGLGLFLFMVWLIIKWIICTFTLTERCLRSMTS